MSPSKKFGRRVVEKIQILIQEKGPMKS